MISVDSMPLYPKAGYWLFAVTALVMGMVVLGGATRLTGSGLSIVEWKPFTGIVPPFTQEDWGVLFTQYQKFPEFQKINATMTLAEFKGIFWLEFIHRLWGRLVGIFLLIPTIMLVKEQKFRKAYGRSLVLLWILGTLQGVLGWSMVKSGLVKDPHVSPYRLMAHLLLAFLILGHAFVMAFHLVFAQKKPYAHFQKRSALLLISISLTIAWGALVAGHKAGWVYNTFPTMNGHWWPPELWFLKPVWRNFFENPPSVQFFHRFLAFVTLLVLGSLGIPLYNTVSGHLKKTGGILVLLGATQGVLGVLTLLYQVPLMLGLLHQTFAVLLFLTLILLRCQLGSQSFFSLRTPLHRTRFVWKRACF